MNRLILTCVNPGHYYLLLYIHWRTQLQALGMKLSACHRVYYLIIMPYSKHWRVIRLPARLVIIIFYILTAMMTPGLFTLALQTYNLRKLQKAVLSRDGKAKQIKEKKGILNQLWTTKLLTVSCHFRWQPVYTWFDRVCTSEKNEEEKRKEKFVGNAG